MSEVTGLPEKPLSRTEQYLASMAGQETELPEKPLSRVEQYLDYIAKHGGGGGGMTLHVCASGEYDSTTRVPTIQDPDENTIYLVPASDSQTGDLFIEWYYTNNAWEQFGRAKVDISGLVNDVKVNGTSVVTDGVANVPNAELNGSYGLVKLSIETGLGLTGQGNLMVATAIDAAIKNGTNSTTPITPYNQHSAAFYALAKAAGDSTQSASANAVGIYTENAKSAISQMLAAPETVSGSTPSITAKPGVQYICGEVSTLSITVPASGCVDIIFVSGSTPTVLSLPTGQDKISWSDGWDETCEANTTYELNILNGKLGVKGQWT